MKLNAPQRRVLDYIATHAEVRTYDRQIRWELEILGLIYWCSEKPGTILLTLEGSCLHAGRKLPDPSVELEHALRAMGDHHGDSYVAAHETAKKLVERSTVAAAVMRHAYMAVSQYGIRDRTVYFELVSKVARLDLEARLCCQAALLESCQ